MFSKPAIKMNVLCISGCESANYRILFAVFLTMLQKVVFAQMISSNGHSAPVDAFWSRNIDTHFKNTNRSKKKESRVAAAKCVNSHSYLDDLKKLSKFNQVSINLKYIPKLS